MVMAYIDDIVIATETVEDHMARMREVFECLREAGFKMRVAKCDFMKSEIKYLGRVVSAEGVKPDPKAVAKLRDWEIPRVNLQQNGDAEFFGIRQLLSQVHSLARQAGRAPARCHWAERYFHVGSRTTKSVQRNQESFDRGDCACAA